MSRRIVLALVLLALISVPASAGSPPNILFILVDDLRWDSVGHAGNSVIQTPEIDALAAQGARLTRFYTVAPRCAPSRAAILTGLYPHQAGNGIQANELWKDFSDATPTLVTHLNAAGYLTAFVGKAHLGGDPRAWGFQDVPLWLAPGASFYDEPLLMTGDRQRHVQGNITEAFSRTAIEFLQRRGTGDQPWFLWFATTAPHFPGCGSCSAEFPYDQAEIEASPPPGLAPGTPMANVEWDQYYSTITHLDREIGNLLDEVTALGLDSDTFVFLASDNGIMNDSHGIRTKGVWYEESTRLVGIVRGPGITPGTVLNNPVTTVDLLPTFLEIAGVPRPSNLEGKTALPLLTGGLPLRTTIFAEMSANQVAPWQMVVSTTSVSAGYKYVALLGGSEETLYHLDSDEFELVDLLQGTPPVNVLNHMRQLLEDWQAATP
jgi:arylsulfatase A-like enzyme